MITSEEMRELEDMAVESGISKIQLMENAGRGMFEHMIKEFSLQSKRIVIVAGFGNNGGDGFVLARYLKHAGYEVHVIFLGEQGKLRRESGYNYARLKDSHPEVFSDALEQADIIVDAMLGTGIKGRLREPYASMIEKINASDARVIAVDVPTGVNPDTGQVYDKAVDADLIYTFHDIKPGLQKFSYKTKIIDIGL